MGEGNDKRSGRRAESKNYKWINKALKWWDQELNVKLLRNMQKFRLRYNCNALAHSSQWLQNKAKLWMWLQTPITRFGDIRQRPRMGLPTLSHAISKQTTRMTSRWHTWRVVDTSSRCLAEGRRLCEQCRGLPWLQWCSTALAWRGKTGTRQWWWRCAWCRRRSTKWEQSHRRRTSISTAGSTPLSAQQYLSLLVTLPRD